MKDIIADSNEAIKSTNMCNLVTLTYLPDVTKQNKVTRYLTESYKDVRNQPLLTKITVTVINAILTQNRVVFVFKRNFLAELIRSDTNHYKELGFSTDNYRRVVAHLGRFLCDFKRVKRDRHYVLMGTVKHKGILKLLTANIDDQTKEVLEFINKESVGELDTETLNKTLSDSKFRRIKKDEQTI